LQNGTLARMIPDVSADADPNTGFCVLEQGVNQCPATWWGGTSLASPLWAGVVAIWNQYAGVEVGSLGPISYQILNSKWYTKAFHDVTSGSNGFSATPGFDLATGVGSPNVGYLVQCSDDSAGTLNCNFNVGTTSTGPGFITSPAPGSTVSTTLITVAGTQTLKAGNWLQDSPHSVNQPVIAGVCSGAVAAPQLSLLEGWISNVNSGKFNVNIEVNDLTGLGNPIVGATTDVWYMQFVFANQHYYGGLYVTGSSTGGSNALQYGYGTLSIGTSASGTPPYLPNSYTASNGTYTSTAPGVISVTVPVGGVGGPHSGSAFTNLEIYTYAEDGTASTPGFFCPADSFGGSISYNLGDPQEPDGSIQVAIVPVGQTPTGYATASLVNYPNTNQWTITFSGSSLGLMAGSTYTIIAVQIDNGVTTAISQENFVYK
jgi:hypothetical protein